MDYEKLYKEACRENAKLMKDLLFYKRKASHVEKKVKYECVYKSTVVTLKSLKEIVDYFRENYFIKLSTTNVYQQLNRHGEYNGKGLKIRRLYRKVVYMPEEV